MVTHELTGLIEETDVWKYNWNTIVVWIIDSFVGKVKSFRFFFISLRIFEAVFFSLI